jgi:hypothetical protein
MHNPNYPFYRIEGHMGLPIDSAFNYINSLISNFDLPIQLIKVDITNQTWLGFRTNYENFASQYKLFVSDVNNKIATLGNNAISTSIYKNLDKINQNISVTSYRDIDNVTKTLDDLNAYCNLIISSDFVTNTFKPNTYLKAKVKANSKAKSGAGTVPIINYLKTVLDKIFDARNSLAGLYTNPTPIKEISLSQLKGLEYLAGVYKGGTFILLYDGSSAQKPVIADFALPYFYNLDKDRLL